MYKVERVVTEHYADYYKTFHRQVSSRWMSAATASPKEYAALGAICYMYAMELQDIIRKVKRQAGQKAIHLRYPPMFHICHSERRR